MYIEILRNFVLIDLKEEIRAGHNLIECDLCELFFIYLSFKVLKNEFLLDYPVDSFFDCTCDWNIVLSLFQWCVCTAISIILL